MARFPSPWDRSLKLTTCLGIASLLAGGIGLAVLPWVVPGNPRAAPLLLAMPAVVVVLVLATWLLAPRAFAVDGGEVRVERPVLPVAIPLASIRAVEVLPPGALRGALRTAGASGFFGHYGRYWSRQLGTFRMYTTSTSRLVLLETDRGRFVISPDAPEAFVDAVLERARGAERVLARGSPPRLPASAWPQVALVLVLCLVPLLLAAGLLVTRVLAPR